MSTDAEPRSRERRKRCEPEKSGDRTLEAGSIFSPTLRSTSVGMLILITLIAFEAMAVSAALPTAAREVHGLGGYGWAFTGFLVANVVGMVASGRLSDGRGPQTPLVTGLAAFLVGLLLAGTATTMTQLVAGRVVQGLGGGLMITASTSSSARCIPTGCDHLCSPRSPRPG